jgi:murein DD-endopeptidase MepM/ murein hydrolase activator NlpD
LSQRKPSFRMRISGYFRERELYVRSDGHIRYITLKPYMLILMAAFIVVLLTTGIVGGVGYYMASNSVLAFRQNLNKSTDSYKFDVQQSPKPLQMPVKKTIAATTAKLIAEKKKYTLELKNLREAYEVELAGFQSSISQINGRMVKNQDAYRKELERLRNVYATLQKRHAKLADLLDQGWAPRMVTFPVQPQSNDTEINQNNDQRASENTKENKPKKNSSLNLKTVFPDKQQPVSVAQLELTPPGVTPVDIAALKTSMQNQWKKQTRTSALINFSARKRVNELRQILSRLKFNLSDLKLPSTPPQQSNTGGPFVELEFLDIAAKSNRFNENAFASLQPFKKIAILEKALLELPIRRPLADLGSITSPFGPRMDPFRKLYAMHRGIDFGAPTGEPVLATAQGVVITTQKNSKSGYGTVVVIRHKNGIITLYGHLSEYTVKVGDMVKPGDVVGKVGNTGRSTGPHLHYGIRVGDSHVDPIDYFEAATYVF